MKSCRQAHCGIFASLLAGLLFIFIAAAAAERVQDLPKPSDYVNDDAHALSPETITQLDQYCAQLDHSETNTQIAILIVHSLNGEEAADYANQVEDLWRIGKKGSDRGILILLALDDRKYRLDVGYGLEGILPDGKLGDIGRAMVPYLRAGDYDNAVKLAVDEVSRVITADARIALDDATVKPARKFPLGQVFFVSFVLAFFFVPVLLRIGYEFGKLIGLWTGPFPWAPPPGAYIASSSVGRDRDSSSSSSGGSSSSSSGFSGFGGGEFGGGGAGGSW